MMRKIENDFSFARLYIMIDFSMRSRTKLKLKDSSESADLFVICLSHFSNACRLNILRQLEHGLLNSPLAL